MTDTQDLRQTLEDLLVDLRSDTSLLATLSSANDLGGDYGDTYGEHYGGVNADVTNAIQLFQQTRDPFQPVSGQRFDVVVVVGAVTETTQSHNTARSRTWRLQANVAGRQQWRRERDATPGTTAVLDLAEIMGRVADRLDVAAPVRSGVPEGSAGSPIPLEDDDDSSLTMTQQWLVSHTQPQRVA